MEDPPGLARLAPDAVEGARIGLKFQSLSWVL